MTRIIAKTDRNQQEIVDALRKTGASVVSLHQIGHGVPDILVGWHGINFLMEIKDGNKPPSQRKLTPHQIIFHAEWKGQITVVNSIQEALNILYYD
jgi:Holliday junction resolvase